ncbi:MAG: family 43 glycosylhydrolase [Clostridia bacterium]|nr:family 43 glycosylhydrolase [Clostridia bacterium]
MKNQAFNPYLPSWEYIPDGEPYVFGDRVYVYGSHDLFNGYVFCMGDYMGWSAPVNDLSAWRCEGVTYPRCGDPVNADGRMCLYAPDVARGPDGRYYMYYVYDKVGFVSVAVCDTPAGHYRFYGYVHDKQGRRLGDRPGDEPQFDPGVIFENGKCFMYTGFCGHGDRSRHGSMVTVLESDMVTIAEEPKFVVPGAMYAEGTGFEGHAFFEASSIRRRGDTYYFVYSSQVMHELCYATASDPRGPFTYGGVIVSNCDIGIDSYKPADKPTAFAGNNHGSIIEINGQWYVFYHRQTNASWFSRQGCAEPIFFDEAGRIRQAEMTSCGLNGGPLKGEGEYPAYICCNLFDEKEGFMSGDPTRARVTQDGRDDDKDPAYIARMMSGTTAGFKYFDCSGVTGISVIYRGYCHGRFIIRNSPDGEPLCEIPAESSNVWEKRTAKCTFPDGVQALYITWEGGHDGPHLKSFIFEKD